MGYIQFVNKEGKGPIANNLDKERLNKLLKINGVDENSSIFFLCGKEDEIREFAATSRMKIGNELKLIAPPAGSPLADLKVDPVFSFHARLALVKNLP